MYNLDKHPEIQAAMENHRDASLLDMEGEITFLRATIEAAANDAKSPLEILSAVHKPVATVMSAIDKYQNLQVKTLKLVSAHALEQCCKRLVEQLAASLRSYMSEEEFQSFVDNELPLITQAMKPRLEDQKPKPTRKRRTKAEIEEAKRLNEENQ